MARAVYSKKVRQMAARICDVMACTVALHGDTDGWAEDAWGVGLHLFGKTHPLGDYILHTDDSETAAHLADSMFFSAGYDYEQAYSWAKAAQMIREGWPRMGYVLTPIFPKIPKTKRSK